MEFYIGTSGFRYTAWKGDFYPQSTKEENMLSYYGTQLSSVEIDSTFYRMPTRSQIESWRASVPDHFRFALKMSQKITHVKRLGTDSEEELDYLLNTVSTLEKSLGALLVQLPPTFAKDAYRLSYLLHSIGRRVPLAFEFRHPSWNEPEIHRMLENFNAAWCCTETDESPGVFVSTASWGYFRLRRSDYSDQDLKKWISMLIEQSWTQVFVYFKHEGEGARSPLLAKRMVALLT